MLHNKVDNKEFAKELNKIRSLIMQSIEQNGGASGKNSGSTGLKHVIK
jgi:hypothetical protein